MLSITNELPTFSLRSQLVTCRIQLAFSKASKQATLRKSEKNSILRMIFHTSAGGFTKKKKGGDFPPRDSNLNLDRKKLGRESFCLVSVVVGLSEKGTAESRSVLLRSSQANHSHQELPIEMSTRYLFCSSSPLK